MARPPDYKGEQTIKKAREYIASCVDTKDEVNLPIAEGMALYLGIARRTLYDWADKHAEFSHILDELNKEQVKRLVNRGLSGKYNSNIAKLVLAKHGYKDQVGLSGEGEGEPIKINADITTTIEKIYGKSDSESV